MILFKDKLLNNFFDAFPTEKREKVLKYLAFIGMDYVKTFYSTEENLLGKLKHLTKKIKNRMTSGDAGLIKADINNIKNELYKLNEKVKSKPNKKGSKEINKGTIENTDGVFLADRYSRKSSSIHKKSSSLERFERKRNNSNREITPKVTEIDPNDYPFLYGVNQEKHHTKHHLDDEETKSLFKDVANTEFEMQNRDKDHNLKKKKPKTEVFVGTRSEGTFKKAERVIQKENITKKNGKSLNYFYPMEKLTKKKNNNNQNNQNDVKSDINSPKNAENPSNGLSIKDHLGGRKREYVAKEHTRRKQETYGKHRNNEEEQINIANYLNKNGSQQRPQTASLSSERRDVTSVNNIKERNKKYNYGKAPDPNIKNIESKIKDEINYRKKISREFRSLKENKWESDSPHFLNQNGARTEYREAERYEKRYNEQYENGDNNDHRRRNFVDVNANTEKYNMNENFYDGSRGSRGDTGSQHFSKTNPLRATEELAVKREAEYSSDDNYVFQRKKPQEQIKEPINEDISAVGHNSGGSSGVISNRLSSPETPPEMIDSKGKSQRNNKNILQIADSFLTSPIAKQFSRDEKEEQEEEEEEQFDEEEELEVRPDYSNYLNMKSSGFERERTYGGTRQSRREPMSDNLLGSKYTQNRVESIEMSRLRKDNYPKYYSKSGKTAFMSSTQNAYESPKPYENRTSVSSSNFSMFTPNEELKSFFKKEFVMEVNNSKVEKVGSFLQEKNNKYEKEEYKTSNMFSSINDYLPKRERSEPDSEYRSISYQAKRKIN